MDEPSSTPSPTPVKRRERVIVPRRLKWHHHLSAFLIFAGTSRIDDLLGTVIVSDFERARRNLVGFAAISAILFGGVWSFIGPKDFGRRIPLRISHGALGGLAVWAAITFATMLSSDPRSFLSGSLDTYYSLLTVVAANRAAGATAGWAMSTDVLSAAGAGQSDKLLGA